MAASMQMNIRFYEPLGKKNFLISFQFTL